MSWKGSLVVTSLGGSPDIVSWLSVEAGSETVSADQVERLLIPDADLLRSFDSLHVFLKGGHFTDELRCFANGSV